MSKKRYLLIFLINLQCAASNKLPAGIIKLLTPVAIDSKKHEEMSKAQKDLIEETQRLQEAETLYSKQRFDSIRTGMQSPTPCPERTILLKALYAKLTELNEALKLNQFSYKCSLCSALLNTINHNCQQDAASSSRSFVSENNASTSTLSSPASEEDTEFRMPNVASPESPVKFLKPSDMRMGATQPKPPSAPSEFAKEQVARALRRNRSMPEIPTNQEAQPYGRLKPVTRRDLNNEQK